MSIIRRHKTESYSVISNHCLRNKCLSAKAKGIFAYIMTLPDDWKLYRTELVNHFSDGKDSLRAGFDELIEAGYIIQTQLRDEAGKMAGWEYDIHETPPEEKPIAENPPSDNPPLPITKKQPTTEETNGVGGGNFNEEPAGKTPLPPTPKKAAAPLPPTLEEALAYGVTKGWPAELTEKAWNYYQRLGWKDRDGNRVKSWKHKIAGVWMTPDKIAEFRPQKERAVLKDGTLYFVDRPRCGDQWMRAKYTAKDAANYTIITPEEYKNGK
jgi:hypothetical protein